MKELKIWERTHRLSKRFDELNKTPNANYETFKTAIEHENPEISANILRCLINVTMYLLERQVKALELHFSKTEV